MEYDSFGLGVLELKNPNLSFFTALAEAQNLKLAKPTPITLNLDDANNVFGQLGVQQYSVITKGGVKVGLTSMVSASLQAKPRAPGVKFIANNRFLPVALKKFGKGPGNMDVDVTIAFLHPDYSQPNPAASGERAGGGAGPRPVLRRTAVVKNPNAAPVDLIVRIERRRRPRSSSRSRIRRLPANG